MAARDARDRMNLIRSGPEDSGGETIDEPLATPLEENPEPTERMADAVDAAENRLDLLEG